MADLLKLKEAFVSQNEFVDERQILVVGGYVRSHNNESMIIPPLVTQTIFYFYHNLLFTAFEQMYLHPRVLQSVYEYGFETPSQVQQRAIVPMILQHDVVVQAQSGTGKTSTFCVAALQRLNELEPHCQTLILAPTRELSHNIAAVMRSLGKSFNATARACVGGTSVREVINAFQQGIQIIVATPGRLYDMLHRKPSVLKLHALQMVVLDEMDELLARGFTEILQGCAGYVKSAQAVPRIQMAMFSATLPKEMEPFIEQYMRHPIRLEVPKQPGLTLDGIRQYYIDVQKEQYKLDTLCDIYASLPISSCIIYCNTRRKVVWLLQQMKQLDFNAVALHGDMNQSEREQVLKQFKSGCHPILVKTDLLPIMPKGIAHHTAPLVINYDFPLNVENYIHRCGQSGCNGRKGAAFNFVCDGEMEHLRVIETFYNTNIDELPADISHFVF